MTKKIRGSGSKVQALYALGTSHSEYEMGVGLALYLIYLKSRQPVYHDFIAACLNRSHLPFRENLKLVFRQILYFVGQSCRRDINFPIATTIRQMLSATPDFPKSVEKKYTIDSCT